MSRELMQQALEAFEWNYNTDLDNIPACEQWAKMLKKNIAALRERLAEPGTWREVTNDQLIEEVRNRGYEIRDAKITALRQARSLTDELMDCVDRLGSEADTVDPRVWQHLLVYAPKHEKEPVTWADAIIDDLQGLFDTDGITEQDSGDALIRLSDAIAAVEDERKRYTAPPKQEPVAWMCKRDDGHFDVLTDQTCKKCFPVYTAPPNREWVGLTDEEIAQGPQEVLPALYGRWGWAEKEAFEAVVAWAEAKLKEKNHG